ncbi:MAG: HYR domain-containing protein, partial [Thermoanaerobaculia bacterium]|nr:HYR domain-containing protein [Thermoanaerobaculia bacterium]
NFIAPDPNGGAGENWGGINYQGSPGWYDFPLGGYPGAMPFIVEFDCLPTAPTLVSGLPSGSTFPAGTTTVVYQITDGSGNTATCSFAVTVIDDNDPA